MFDDPDGSVTGGRRDVIHKRSGVYVYVGAYVSLTNNNHPPRSRCLRPWRVSWRRWGTSLYQKYKMKPRIVLRVLTDDWIE